MLRCLVVVAPLSRDYRTCRTVYCFISGAQTSFTPSPSTALLFAAGTNPSWTRKRHLPPPPPPPSAAAPRPRTAPPPARSAPPPLAPAHAPARPRALTSTRPWRPHAEAQRRLDMGMDMAHRAAGAAHTAPQPHPSPPSWLTSLPRLPPVLVLLAGRAWGRGRDLCAAPASGSRVVPVRT